MKERLKINGSVRIAGWFFIIIICSGRPFASALGQALADASIDVRSTWRDPGRRADEVLPARFNFDRYSAMVKNSPFAIATAAALPAATPNFAKDLYVANAAHSPEGDMATIASSSDQNFKKYLTTREPVDGYSIASIEWSDRVGATKVTISKDGNFATLTFNEALLAQQAPPNARPAPGRTNRALPSPLLPAMPRQARTRGVIQRNPQATAKPTPDFAPIPAPMPTLDFAPIPAPMPTPDLAPIPASMPTPNLEPVRPANIDPATGEDPREPNTH